MERREATIEPPPVAPRALEDLEHERKFLLPVTAVPTLLAWLAGSCRPDPSFPHGVVTSIYYDTPDLALLYEKVNSDYIKTKIRVRWYSTPEAPEAGGPAFLEAKYRIGDRREKIRVPVAETGAELLSWGLADSRVLDLPRRLRDLGVPLRGRLVPTMVIRYVRRRFVEPLTSARVSVDTDISVPAALGAAAAGRQRLPVAVAEVKGDAAELPPSLYLVTGLGGRRTSFSKYWACYQHAHRVAM